MSQVNSGTKHSSSVRDESLSPTHEQGLAVIRDCANKVALSVRLLTVLQLPDEKTNAQNMLEAQLIKFAEAINALQLTGRWRPIETAPTDGERILLCENGTVFQGYWDREIEDEGGQCWREEGMDMQRCFPTSWMPLPDPPEQPST